MKSHIDLSIVLHLYGKVMRYYQSLTGLAQGTLFALVGIILGLCLFLARISNAVSYLSDAPETCMNCHVMTDAYATWKRSSHGRNTICVDCHVPHANPVAKYAFKAKDGLKHSYVFTLRKEPQVLRLSAAAKPVVQVNCVRCHGNQLLMIRVAAASERNCWSCHSNIHGKVHSLSASPEVLRPIFPDAGLNWMKKGN